MMEKPWEIDLSIYDDEQELLDGLRRRDRMACTCLLKQYAPRMLRLATQLMGDPDESEDVLQEAFIRACDQIDSFRRESGLGTWLHRIVINTALMRLRKRRPERTPDIETLAERAGGAWHSVASGSTEPGSELLDSEFLDALDRSVARLPESLRTAFVLRDVEELSTREAAELLGISESALKVRLHRARLALRKDMSSYLAGAASEGHQDEVRDEP
jgi:RNA polymerase sigma-70 factor, ECF subfamily